jgi:hypothetical protein
MQNDPSTLSRLAENRRRRMDDRARPTFELTADEARKSSDAAMRLADAAPEQVRERLQPAASTSA